MSYELQFLPTALKEWRKLGVTLQSQFKNKLKERLAQPHVVADGLHGMPSHYKIKLRSARYHGHGNGGGGGQARAERRL
jgi:mRNA interferase RelE/StbE